MKANTTERTREFVRYFNSNYIWFEEITGITASKWRDLDRGKTKAVTAEMIDAFCRSWPEFAYWLVTGEAASSRGQFVPDEYLDLTYGIVSVLERGAVRFWRDEAGELCPGTMHSGYEEKMSPEHEVVIAARFLFFSAVVNESDAEVLASQFWKQFLKPLRAGQEIVVSLSELKKWTNLFPANIEKGKK